MTNAQVSILDIKCLVKIRAKKAMNEKLLEQNQYMAYRKSKNVYIVRRSAHMKK